MKRIYKIIQSGHIAPKRSSAVIVFRYWHEARKRGDMTELRKRGDMTELGLLSQQVYQQAYSENCRG